MWNLGVLDNRATLLRGSQDQDPSRFGSNK